MSQRHRRFLWPAAFALVALTCTSDDLTLPSEGLPSAMAAVSGSGQSAVVASPLPDSLVVRVTDSEDRPVEGAKVVFTALLGGGDAVPDTALTNKDGVAGARWLLGPVAGPQQMQAMVVGPTSGGALTQVFNATAIAAPADTIFQARGNGQSAEVGATLADSLVVRVTDRYGNPVSGTAVTWAPTGGGTVSPSSVPTAVNGTAATRRTLGPTAGAQGATATAAGLKGSPVSFTSTALPAAPTSLIKSAGDNQTAAAGSAAPESLVVVLLDASGNGVPGRNVTFAVATGGGSTSPTSANTDANGRAATRWTLGTTAGPNSLIASSSGFSVTFQATATAAAPANLLANSATSQSDTAGLPAAATPSVRVTDANGNPVQGVSVTFAVSGGGGSILPVSPVATDGSGVASLSVWTLGQTVGANTVTATVAGLAGSPVSFNATGVAGSAARLQVQTEPSPSAQSGVAFAVQPAVRLVDVFGNAVATAGTVVTAALASGSGTLGGTLTATTIAGVATFANLSITGPTGSYTLRFTSGSLVPDTSAVITIGAGAATRLGMVTQPSASAQNAVAFAQQPRVRVLDAAGNPVAGVRSVTVAINTGGGTLGGTATVNTDATGLATFAGLMITGATGSRTLAFSSAGLTSVTSTAVAITAGVPTQMAVNAGNNQTATAGSAVAVDPSVVIRDVSNNPVPGVSVTFSVASGGGSVVPTSAVTTNASGVAAVTSWTLGTAAGSNTLTANAAPSGIAGDPVTFTATAVAGGAGRLGMVTQPPATAVNAAAFSVAPVIQLQDVNGNPVATAGIAITVAIASGPGGATLGGLTTVGTDATGRATFTGLSITGLVGSYTLQFTSPSVTGVTSSAIALTAGAAARLAITTAPPVTAQSGVAMAPATVVQVQDAQGNAVSASGLTVTAAIASGGGTLAGGSATTGATGAATFAGLTISGTAGPRTLTFSSGALTPATSGSIVLTAGPAASVAFGQGPSNVVAGQVMTPAVTVRVLDGAGNVVTTPAQTVALTLSANPGGATLGGTTSMLTVSGVATFGTLTLNRSGTGYRMRAAAGALVPDTSATFNVTAGAATTIAANSATSQSDTAGRPVAAPPSVLVTDGNANPVPGVAVTFAVTGGGGSLLPVAPVTTNASGIATLTSWTLGGTAGVNTATATVSGLAGSPVTFTATGVAGAATQLVIQTQPSPAAQSGVPFAIQPVVRVADAFGNTVTTSSAVVTAALASGSGTLGGTLTATAAAGIASFTNLSITGATGAYTVRFTSGALTPDTSTAVTLGAGSATRLEVAQQPSTTVQNAVAFPQQPTVQLRDAAGNPVAMAGTVVTASIASGGGALGGTPTATTNAAGLATFTNLVITGTIGARTLAFNATGLTPDTSGAVTVGAGAATQIAISAGNGLSATVGTAVATPPTAVVRDVSGNVVAGVPVTFAVASGGGSVLPASAVLTNAAGLAAATSWTLGTTAGANAVTATSTGLTGSPLTFTATGTAAAATRLVIQTQPSPAAQSGVPFAIQPVVRVADAFGNTVTSSSASVTAALASGTGTLGGTLTATAASGVATFSGLAITGAAGSYTIRFTSGALTPDTSTAVTLGAGAAARLAVAQQPSASAQNAIAFPQQPTVQLQDAAGNPVAQGGTVVTAAIASGGGVLGGTLTATTNAAGLATFTNLMITGTVGARTLSFSSGALAPDTSGTVTLTAGTATQIAVNLGNGQSATVNTAVATPPSAVVRDVSGNPVAGVSVAFAVSAGGGSILPVLPVTTNASGVAALTSWTLGTTAGANSLQASSAGLTGSPVTFTATGTAGAATQLQMAAQPAATAQSGVALTAQPAVRLADAFGNAVTTSGTVVTAAIASGSGTLGGTLTATSASGVATFTNLAISGTAGSYTLRFTSGALTPVTSTAITLGAGAAARLAMVVQPSDSAQNALAFPRQPQVQVQDAAGNAVAGVASVTAAILTGGGTLGGTATVSSNAAGLATFAGLSVTGTVGVRTLTFTSGGLTAATSAGITVTPGLPTQMAINAGNGQSATAGTAVATPPSVLVRDVSNNPVPAVAVTFSVASGGGSAVPATPVLTSTAGIAAATSWTLGTAAGANTLTADAAPAGIIGDPVTFTATAVAGSAGRLAILTQPPANAASGAVLSPAPVVQLEDINGNPVTTSNFPVSVAIASGPGGTLTGGTIALTDVQGRATFTGLTISGPTGSYTLQFTGASVTGVTSSAVALAAGAAARVTVVTQPSTAQSGLVFPTAPTVQVQDAAGNPVAGAGRSISVVRNAGTATLTGPSSQTTNGAGLATFPSLVLTGTLGQNTLLFSSAGLTADESAPIALTAGNASQLTIEQQPSASAQSGVAIAQQPTVQVRDASGNPVAGVRSITAAILTGGGTLGGTATVSTNAAGLATFAGLSITGTVGSRTLQFTSTGLTAATSSAIAVTAGAATQLTMVQQPSATAQNGVAFAQQPTVQVRDASGNPVAGVRAVTAAIATGGGTLGGTATINTDAAGLATFAGLSITGTVGSRTLQFTSTGLAAATSSAISLTAGAATQLVMVQQPSATAQSGVAIAQQPTVRVEDASGNPVAGVRQVTAGIATGGGALGGTATINTDAAGLATFAGLSITGTVGSRTLQFTSTGLATATSSAIAITAGAATQLTMVQQPSATAQNGVAFAQQPTVQVRDASGNPVAGVRSVTAAIASGGGTLGGTATINTDASGLATFAGLSITGTVGSRTLQFTSGALTPATSTTVTTTAGAPAALEFGVQPTGTTVGAAIAPPVTVRIEDASGNLTASTATVALAFGANPGTATLGGTASLAAVAGVATFSSLTVSAAGAGYTLAASSAGLTGDTSAAFTITAAATTTAIASDLPDPSVVGQPVTVSYSVTGPGGTPTGNVTVSDGAGASCIGTVAAGSCALTFATPGARTLTATYSGDASHLTSVSAGVTHGVSQAATTTTITSDLPDPSTRGAAVTVGWTVAVTAPGAGTPTGNVTVSDGVNSCVAAVGAGSCAVALTTVGTRNLTATYAGDASFAGSASAVATHTVTQAATTTAITSDSPEPSVVGEAVTVNYTVTSAGGTPTGNVTVSDGAGSSCVGTVAAGTCAISFPTAGARNLTASYAGDANFTASASTPAAHSVNQASTAPAIGTHNPNPSPRGTPVTVTWTVPVVAPGAGTPTGNVTAGDGVDSCVAAVAAGSCSVALTTVGARQLTVVYAGDANFAGATSPQAAHTVTQAASTTTLTSDLPDPSVVGQPVTVSYSVTGPGGTPTGNVTVSDGAGASCIGTVAAGSCALTFATPGARTLTASYAGDANYLASASATAAHAVNQAATTTTITSDLPDPSTRGAAVTVAWSVAVTAPGAGTPTGNVTVSDGVDSCVAAVAAGSCSVALSTVGSRPLTATYAGDASFTGSASAAATHTVTQAATTTAITSDSPEPSVVGQAVTVNYTVTSAGGTPTGNVTVSDGVNSCVGTAAAGSCAVALTTVGTRSLTATYAGDVNFAGSASASAVHTVNQAATTTTITSDLPDPSTRGAAVTVGWTVAVTAPGAGTPTGNVTVSDGVNSCVAAVGAGSCAVALTTVGTRNLTATYAGDASFAGSASAVATHTVTQAATTTAITSDSPEPSVVGEAVTVNYTVTSAGGTPTGNVTVSDGAGSSCVGTVAAGNCTLSFPTAGPRNLTATYAGDVNFTGSASAPAAHAVNQAATTTTITSDLPDPSTRGAAVTVAWSVAVTAPGAGTPTGNVTVSDGVDSCVAAVGAGSCTVTLTTVGTRNLTATYSGDASFAGSASGVAPHTVTQAATTTAITSDSPEPSVVGQAVTVNYTVTSAGGTPTGNVTVSDGVNSCVATVAAGSCTVALTTVGTRSLAATYAGDVNFAGSASAPASHTVNQAATTTTIQTNSPNPSTTSTPVAVTWSVAVTAPGAGTPTGTVTVSDGVDSCNAAVAAGGCSLTLTTLGSRTLVATYSGDAAFLGSASAGTLQTVQ